MILFFLLGFIMLFGGYSIAYFSDIKNNREWFGENIINNKSYLARITDAPSEKEHTWKVPVTIINSISDGHATTAKGKAFLYLYKDRFPVLLHKGDTIFVPGKWQPIKNPDNPFEFDYAGYCRRNNIYYQQFCSANDIRLYATNDPASTPFIDRAHEWCMAELDKYITDPKTKGLIRAMLLGDEVNLDPELLQSYSETGIIHIIAISGGNVAIFFFVISFLLWWLRHKRHLWIKYAVALPLVWFYVLMAGAPPSAVRAAIMFSLLAFAVMLQKNNNTLNQLLATAFLLLCAQPMWLFSAGFQLSFVAVLSIILFYGPVYNWLSPTNKIAKGLWSAVAASISAELLVAPLVIYYFHTFPLLFIVANVAAYLFMTVVLIMGMVIIVSSFFPVIAKFIGICTVWLVTWFDGIVTWLQSCNPVSFHFLMLTGVELILLYFIIAGFVLFLLKKQKPAIFAAAIASCILMFSFCKDKWKALHQQRFVIYNTGKANHIELVKGNYYTVLYTDTGSQKKTDYVVKPSHIGWRAWKQDSSGIQDIYEIGGKTVLILNRDIDSNTRFHADYLVVNYSGKIYSEELRKIFSPSLVIIGNNYNRRQQDGFTKEFEQAGVAIHCMDKDGAIVIQ